jgi:antitoxin VapB
MRTRAFKNGYSQAVRIPAETAYDSTDIELGMVRIGDRIVIEPVAQSPGELIRKMKALPDFIAEGRENDEQEERSPLFQQNAAFQNFRR